jgi:hypothetical protein
MTEKKSRYDRNKPCPLGSSQEDWADFCDWVNEEGEYADLPSDKLVFPKTMYFISWNDEPPVILSVDPADENNETVSWFDRKVKEISKLPRSYFDSLINKK